MRLYVDLDDVLSDTVATFLRVARDRFDREVRYEDVHSFDLAQSLALRPHEYAEFMRCVHEPEILLGIPPIVGSREVVGEWLASGDQVVVATGRPPHSAAVCRRWLLDNGFDGTNLLLVDKYKHSKNTGREADAGTALQSIPTIGFDIAIEDSLEVAMYLSRYMPRRVLLPDRPWNRSVGPADAAMSLVRVKGWEQIRKTVADLRRHISGFLE